MSNKLVITLDLYYGTPSYNEKGQVISRKEPVKLIYGSVEWDNFMKHLELSDIRKAEVTKIYDLEKKEEIKDESIQEAVNVFFKQKEVALSPEKMIEELQKQVKLLQEANKTSESAPKVAKAKTSESAPKAE